MQLGTPHDNIGWIIQALTLQLGYGLFYTVWRAVLGVLSPIFRTAVEKFLASLIPEDRTWIFSFLDHRGWRIARAVITAITAIQLPSIETVNKVVEERRAKSGNTTTFTNKPPTPQ